MLTLSTLKKTLPKHTAKNITQSTVDVINGLTEGDGEDFSEAYRENFLTYTKVLSSGTYKITDYMNAVRFVSYKLMKYSNIECYMRTFPDRYDRLLDQYQDLGDETWIRENKIAAFVSMYNQNQLVNLIMDQSTIPSRILNAPMHQDALNVLAQLMVGSRSDMVRMQAASNILVHLKAPETAKIELDINVKENDVIGELRKVTQELAESQRLSISSGVSTSAQIAESKIIEGEVVDG